ETQVQLVEAYCKEQGLFHTKDSPEANYSDTLSLDLHTVEPSLAGPSRPQDRVRLGDVKDSFAKALPQLLSKAKPQPERKALIRLETESGDPAASAKVDGSSAEPPDTPEAIAERVKQGSVVIAAITSCTNTSNPSVMIAAGLLARKAVERGLQSKPWVKTSL